MASRAFGIIASPSTRVRVEGLHAYRPIGAFSFLGRFRVIDFPISNMSNSGMDRVMVFIAARPRSIAEHIGSGRHYNINSKRGKIQLLFTQNNNPNDIYNTDIAAYQENREIIARMHQEYVIITPSYMVFRQNFDTLLEEHIESKADITMLYHRVENAKETCLNCNVLTLNKQKGVQSIDENLGNAKEKNISMDTYVMHKELFQDLIKEARKESSAFTLADIINMKASELDVRAVGHRGFFAAITSLKDYFYANQNLLDFDRAQDFFREDWPFYTRTNDSCPTQYYEGAKVNHSFISNGCLIEGTVEDSIIGRNVWIKKGAVVKNSIVLAYSLIDEGVHIEHEVVDKWAQIKHVKELISTDDKPGYVRRSDIL